MGPPTMKSKNPRVLVVMSLYNPGDDLFFSIDSVLAQTYKNIKLLIVVDGQIEAYLLERLKRTAIDNRKIKLRIHSANKGLTIRLIEEVKAAPEKLIARIDAGDIWYPQKLNKQIEKLRGNPFLFVLGTQVNYKFGEKIIGRSHFPEKKQQIIRYAEKNRGIMEHSTIIFNKEYINYREFFTYAQDFDLYLRALKIGEIENISEALVESQIKVKGISFKNRIVQEKFQQIALENYRNGGNLPKKPPEISFISTLLWNASLPLYTQYVLENHKNGRNLRAIMFLLLACLINFQLLLIYSRKIR